MTPVNPRVQRHLESGDISCIVRRHRDFSGDIRTPADVAEALGYELARITKSVFCRSRSAGSYAVLVAPVDRRIDFKHASAALDHGRLEVASPFELDQVTGYPPQGVSPLGLDSSVAVVVARELLDHDSVLVGAGALGVEIELSALDLVRVTDAVIDKIAARS